MMNSPLTRPMVDGTKRRWRFINTGFHSGAYNMQFDELLAAQLSRGTGQPTLRVYGWRPYAISLGFHQDGREIDRRRCRAHGVDVVHRPTGGRAIFHAHELTYSVVMSAEGRSITRVYHEIGTAIICALRHLGVEAQMARTTPNFPELYRNHRDSILCFTSISRSEIQYCGKKIVGSAQRRFGDVVLQHGSLLLGPQHRNLIDYIIWPNPYEKEIMETVMKEKTTEVESILDRRVSFDEAAEAMRKGFEESWGIILPDQDERSLHIALTGR